MAKGLKQKVRKSWGLVPKFVEVTGERLVGGGGGAFCHDGIFLNKAGENVNLAKIFLNVRA